MSENLQSVILKSFKCLNLGQISPHLYGKVFLNHCERTQRVCLLNDLTFQQHRGIRTWRNKLIKVGIFWLIPRREKVVNIEIGLQPKNRWLLPNGGTWSHLIGIQPFKNESDCGQVCSSTYCEVFNRARLASTPASPSDGTKAKDEGWKCLWSQHECDAPRYLCLDANQGNPVGQSRLMDWVIEWTEKHPLMREIKKELN